MLQLRMLMLQLLPADIQCNECRIKVVSCIQAGNKQSYRDRDQGRDRQTDRHTDTKTDTHRYRHRQTRTERHAHTNYGDGYVS